MRKLVLVLVVLAALPAAAALAGNYNFLLAEAVKQKIEAKERMLLLDIQVEDEYASHHIPGALATYAYPVKSEADRARLGATLSLVKAGSEPVVIVCPRGGGGAERTYDYLKGQGVPEQRLFILEKGQQGWPYPKLTEMGM